VPCFPQRSPSKILKRLVAAPGCDPEARKTANIVLKPLASGVPELASLVCIYSEPSDELAHGDHIAERSKAASNY